MQKNKISIVTPSFNQGEFIEESICSILSQNYNNFEHIIIDGGSNDNTINILKKYPHLIWVSEPDKGQSDAINKGLFKASGDWILWLNADDVLLPNALNKYCDVFSKNPFVDVIHGHVIFFLNGYKSIFRKQYFNNFSLSKSIFRVVIHPSTGTLFSSKIFKNNNLDIRFHYMMDAEWYMRCGKNLNLIVVNDFLVKFRVSDSNKTSVQILSGNLNNQQIIEKKMLYDIYAKPYFNRFPFPDVIIFFLYKIIRYFLLYINRFQKLRFYIKYSFINEY